MDGLFGADFEIDITKTKAEAKKLAKKLEQEKQIEENTSKYLKSKSLSIQERLDIIKDKVLAILGKQIENTICIRTLEDFKNYIDKALKAGIIAVDTETNNTTDPINCEMMGLCLYVPGEKQAYIPINHIDLNTKQLLPNQLTYIDCKNQLQRVLDNKVYILMHNGKFDYDTGFYMGSLVEFYIKGVKFWVDGDKIVDFSLDYLISAGESLDILSQLVFGHINQIAVNTRKVIVAGRSHGVGLSQKVRPVICSAADNLLVLRQILDIGDNIVATGYHGIVCGPLRNILVVDIKLLGSISKTLRAIQLSGTDLSGDKTDRSAFDIGTYRLEIDRQPFVYQADISIIRPEHNILSCAEVTEHEISIDDGRAARFQPACAGCRCQSGRNSKNGFKYLFHRLQSNQKVMLRPMVYAIARGYALRSIPGVGKL